ncbi:MAG TPA: PadR family transcriptional regulator [Dehalococcoidia bacterium]|nr:PadR family transcriptional regulator [Dehalococcoidia bacterium]
MPRVRRGPTVAHYALLGLLHLAPAHGYELARRLRADPGLRRVVALNPPMLYALLHDLEADGYVAGAAQPDTYPPRVLFRPTDAGADAFRRWLETPVERLREVRNDFLLKLYFARSLAADRGLGLLERQIAAVERYIERTAAERDAADPGSFERLVLDSKVTAAKSTLRWLDRYRAVLAEAVAP